MSSGANMSSGYTSKLNDNVIYCGIPKSVSDKCCIPSNPPGIPIPVAVYPSMLLASRVCPEPTPAQFALYPKVAVPCSVRTNALQVSACATLPHPTQRGAQ